jgi:tRNA A37 threonylcarbamoyltransferase TsaD
MAAWCRRSRRARNLQHLPALVRHVLDKAGVAPGDLSAVAATAGRG